MTPLDNRIDEDFVARYYRGEAIVLEGQLEDVDGAVEQLDGLTFFAVIMMPDGDELRRMPAAILRDTSGPYFQAVFDGEVSTELYGQSALRWALGQYVAGRGNQVIVEGPLILRPGPVARAIDGAQGAAAIAHRFVRRLTTTGRSTVRISNMGPRGLSPWEAEGKTREQYQADLTQLATDAGTDIALDQVGAAITELGETTSQKIAEVDDAIALSATDRAATVKATTDAKLATKAAQDKVDQIGDISAAVGEAKREREQAGVSAAAAAATVPTVAADLDGVPWVHHDGLTLTGVAAGLAWTDPIRTVARAIKHVLLEGAVSGTEIYYLSTLCYEDQAFGDQIILRRASDNGSVALSGTGVVAKSANGPTEVSFSGNGIRVRMLIDYRELTKGVVVNSGTKTPLMISRAVSAVEQDRTNRHEQLRGSLWLEPDAPGLMGLAATYIWDSGSRQLARAIKDVVLIGADPTKRYRLYQVANNHAVEKDRIRIVDEATQQSVLDTTTAAVVTRNAGGITRVELVGAALAAVISIDYRELVDGTNYAVANAPLIIARQSVTDTVARRTALPRLRNIALDPAGLAGAGVFQGAGPVPAQAAAGAELATRGVTKSHPFGTNANNTAIYKRELVQGRPNGRCVFVSVYVYSATGADWPPLMALYPYSAATGGAIVAGNTVLENTFDQVTPNLRRYRMRARLPATGTIASIAYGFNAIVANSAAELGGWTIAISDADLSADNVALDDWTGWSTRDAWRDNVDANLAGAAALATAAPKLRPAEKPWFNSFPNPNLDPLEAIPTWIGSATTVAPASQEMVRRGVAAVANVGTGGSFRLRHEAILDASASGQWYFTSVYAYSADGVTWPAPGAYWYAGATLVGGGALPSYIQIDANLRLYYGAGQLPARADLTHIRLGTVATVAGTVAQIGGFTFVRYAAALTIDDIVADQWYPQATRRDAQIDTRRKAIAGGGLPFAGETWVMTGDSITDSFGVPEQVAIIGGANVINAGFGGCRWTTRVTQSQPETWQVNFSMCRLAQAIASGDWSAQIQAAADNYAADNTYDKRAKVAALAALDWSRVSRMTLDWGTNDWSAGRALGDPASTAETEINGAINLSISRIQAKYPAMQLVLITPWWRGPNATLGDSNINPNANGLMLRDVQDAIVARGRYHQVPVIRMHELVGINLGNVDLFTGDHLHPRVPAGRDRKAKLIVNQMRRYAA